MQVGHALKKARNFILCDHQSNVLINHLPLHIGKFQTPVTPHVSRLEELDTLLVYPPAHLTVIDVPGITGNKDLLGIVTYWRLLLYNNTEGSMHLTETVVGDSVVVESIDSTNFSIYCELTLE